MASNLKLGEVRVMLADARAHIRATLKTALTHAGLENVDHTGTIETVADSLEEASGPDILICDMGLRGGEACDLIRSIRHNEVGKNPFLCIIGITWNPTEPEVQRVIDAGVDLLVAAPMSPKSILDRVDALVHQRMPFIITSDYVGPDRRKDRDRQQTIPLVDVPNTLRAKALGLWDANLLRRQIERAVRDMKACKVERQAQDIAEIADMIYAQVSNAGGVLAQPQMDRLHELVGDLERRASDQGFRHISELCEACVGVVRQTHAASLAPAEKDLMLLKHLALAIRKAMQPNENETAIVHDIARTVIAAR